MNRKALGAALNYLMAVALIFLLFTGFFFFMPIIFSKQLETVKANVYNWKYDADLVRILHYPLPDGRILSEALAEGDVANSGLAKILADAYGAPVKCRVFVGQKELAVPGCESSWFSALNQQQVARLEVLLPRNDMSVVPVALEVSRA
jgi:hypothetical protein